MAKDKWADRDYVLKAVKEDGKALERAAKSLQADREVVLEAVKEAGWVLEFADEELLDDREFMLEAIEKVETFEEVSQCCEGWMDNEEFLLEAIKRGCCTVLDFAEDPELPFDREFMLAAVRLDARAIWHADESLCSDREFVLEAVRTSGSTVLEYAAKELHNDPEVKRIAERQG